MEKNFHFKNKKKVLKNIFKTLFPTIYRDMLLLFANLRYNVAQIIYNDKKKTRMIDTSLCVTTHPPLDFCRTLPFNLLKKISEVILNNQHNISQTYSTTTSYNS